MVNGGALVMMEQQPLWGKAPPLGAAAASAPPSRKRRPDDAQLQEEAADLEQQQQGQQPPQRRRRLSGGSFEAVQPAFPSPPPPAPLSPPFPQQPDPQQQLEQQRAEQQQVETQQEEPWHSGLKHGWDGDETIGSEPPSQRQRAGCPEYRLMLPTPLPPAVPAPLLAAQPPWGPSQQASDAWAVVPYSPPLVSAASLRQQEEQQRHIKVRALPLLAELRVLDSCTR